MNLPMRHRPVTWAALSLLLIGSSVVVWHFAEQARERRFGPSPQPTNAPTATTNATQTVRPPDPVRLLSQAQPPAATSATPAPAADDHRFPYRVRNTPASVDTLARSDHGVLLENALIDTARPVELPIPEHLRARGDHGSYIVQARGRIDAAFRNALREAGAEIISYIPQNAYLVRAGADAARQLMAHPRTQAVLDYHPYYKLRSGLIEPAVKQMPLPPDTLLEVLLFANRREATLTELAQMGATVLSEDRSPFGPVVLVRPPETALVELAGLPGVQLVDTAPVRVRANDLSRPRVSAAPDTLALTNYLGLTGSNVLVAVCDSGVDTNHPALLGRVIPDPLFPASGVDRAGHGTHVAGIIAGNGAQSSTVSNASGSILPAIEGQFRGLAPGANIFSLLVQVANEPFAVAGAPRVSDAYLQETAAATNARIANHSWVYAGNRGYDLHAASYDAAVRDALPRVPGSQPLLCVFAAGNGGNGDDDGLGGNAGTIASPGTAKNVITVGALEALRNLTNGWEEIFTNGNEVVTNVVAPFARWTDSDRQVAPYSARGNVGPGLEGEAGRFKPDVVAPGTFVISTRSGQWDTNAYYGPRVETVTRRFENLQLSDCPTCNRCFSNVVFVFDNATNLVIEAVPNVNSPVPFPDLAIYVAPGDWPTDADRLGTNRVSLPPDRTLDPVGTAWFYRVCLPDRGDVIFDLVTQMVLTNPPSPEVDLLRTNLNAGLGPYYRYESGTSMAAAGVSGVLALMQEFYERRLGRTNSPALMKALLINGARSVASQYDLQVNTLRNHQGWGLVNLTNSLPMLTVSNVVVIEQSPSNALATDQSHTRLITIPDINRSMPLRVTLVWTDPPGNPVAGIKLVNDLDLVVTNLATGDVFFGNDIGLGRDFNQAWDTNEPPRHDVVNNVENVLLQPPLGSNYSVTVMARRVNVNAVTAHPDNLVQDYALVIANGEALDETTAGSLAVSETPLVSQVVSHVTLITNTESGRFLQLERVGAHSPLIGITNGVTNQWNFYVVTNAATNLVFFTFQPLNLAVPRMGVREQRTDNATRVEADIDLYVTTSPALTNLDPAVLAACAENNLPNFASARSRGGNELVILTNPPPGQPYYIGVKSEDRMAAEFYLGVLANVGSLSPCSPQTTFGVIPDGGPEDPGGTNLFFVFVPDPSCPFERIRRVVVSSSVTHELFGDLLGNLAFGSQFAVLNNHVYPGGQLSGTYTWVFEDNGEGDIPGAQPSDGPGSLLNFLGLAPYGLWTFTMVDNFRPATGVVDQITLRLEPEYLTGATNIFVREGQLLFVGSIDVPLGATNLTICISNLSASPQRVDLLVRRGAPATRTVYDYRREITPPGGCLSITRSDLPPLRDGRYYVSIYNPPGNTTQQLRWDWTLDVDLNLVTPVSLAQTGEVPLADDAVTYASQFVTHTQRITTVEVGLRIDHPRISDLAITLISPRGTRILLTENRGWTNASGFGSTFTITNVAPVTYTGTAQPVTNVFDLQATTGTVTIDYNFYCAPDSMRIYYEGVRIFDSGYISNSCPPDPDAVRRFVVNYGPGTSTQLTVVMNEEGNPDPTTEWTYTLSSVAEVHNYVVFTEDTNRTTIPIKFGSPPFTSATNPVTQLLSGFEDPAPGDYTVPQTVDGWTALSTNPVTVLDDPGLAHTGTRLLALAGASITRPLPTLAGRSYTLNFAARGPGIVGMWRGEGNANDSIGGNHGINLGGVTYAPGTVGQAFNIIPASGRRIRIPDQPVFELTNSLSVEGWIQLAGAGNVIFWRGDRRPGLDPYALSLDGSTNLLFLICSGLGCEQVGRIPLPIGPWHHVAGTLDGGTGDLRLYLNGLLVAATNTTIRPFGPLDPALEPSLGIGNVGETLNQFPFNGRIDEISLYSRALTRSEVLAIYAAGARGKFDPSTPLPQGLAQMRLTLGTQQTNIYYADNNLWSSNAISFVAAAKDLPLQLDGLQPGLLLDTFTLTEQPTPLFYLPEESLRALVGERAFGEWRLEIWDNRAGATNVVAPKLLSWQLNFVFEDTTPVPRVVVPGETITNSIPPGEIAYFIVDVPAWASFATNQLLWATAPLNLWFNQNGAPTGTSPGDVRLFGPVTSGSYTLATNGTPPLRPGQRYYLGLENPNTNAVTYAFRVDFDITPLENGVPITGSLAASGLPRYFFYDVTTNGQAALFELYNLTGNLQLVARYGTPLPTLSDFDYLSAHPGTNAESILVLTNSLPVPLAPGRWYLGVFNVDTVPVNYTIRATEFTNLPPVIITLTNAVPYYNTNAGPPANADYYRFVVSPSAARAQFEINHPTGDMTLVVRKGLPPPDLFLYDFLSANPGTNDETILVFTNTAPIPLSPGEWFLTAFNVSGGPVSYAIKATEWPVIELPIIITNAYASNGFFCLTWTSLPGVAYHVEGVTQIGDTNWVTVSPTIVATDYFTTWCLALPSPYHFFRVVEGPATSIAPPFPLPLTHGEPVTNTVAPGQFAFFSVAVPGWAGFATNQLVTATGPLNLWFNPSQLPYGTNAGDVKLLGPTGSGRSVLGTNGVPPLAPAQTYFLALENPDTNVVTFVIQVEFDLVPLTNGIPFTATFSSAVGERYFFFDVSTNAQAVAFDLYDLTGNGQLGARLGLPLPSLTNFHYLSANPGTNPEAILLFPNSSPVRLTAGRWYLGVFRAEATAVDYTIRATELTNALPAIVTLTNAVPYSTTNTVVSWSADYYRFVVSTNAVRAQFEIRAPTADMTLVARKGLPLPDLTAFSLISSNAGLADEFILFHYYSTPVPLTPGEWFLAAVNAAGVPAAYTILATEWPVHGTNITVIRQGMVGGQFCLTWRSLPGARYVVEGLTDLNSTNWVNVSPTLTATDVETTWCIPLPSIYHFFRVREGLALVLPPQPVRFTRISAGLAGVELEWVSPPQQTFRVQWSPAVGPPVWTDFTNVITSTNATFRFVDDGAQTGGLGGTRFYRLLILP